MQTATTPKVFTLGKVNYTSNGEIPVGGQAKLFNVTTPDGKDAVLKLYVNDRDVDPEKGFERERIILEKAKEHGRTDLPLILDSGRIDFGPVSFPAIVTKKVGGKTLDEILSKETNPSKEDVILLASFVGYTLKWAHEKTGLTKSIFHRDISPSNIILSDNGNYVVLDWAAGKFGSGETTRNTQIVTLYYTAPEVTLGRTVTAAADIYSLARVMQCYLLGKDEFENTFNGEPVKENFSKLNITSNIVDALFKATEEKPENRYQSIDDFVHALKTENSLVVADKNAIVEYNRSPKYFSILMSAIALASGLGGLLVDTPRESALLAGSALAAAVTSAATWTYHFYEKRKHRRKELSGEIDDNKIIDKYKVLGGIATGFPTLIAGGLNFGNNPTLLACFNIMIAPLATTYLGGLTGKLLGERKVRKLRESEQKVLELSQQPRLITTSGRNSIDEEFYTIPKERVIVAIPHIYGDFLKEADYGDLYDENYDLCIGKHLLTLDTRIQVAPNLPSQIYNIRNASENIYTHIDSENYIVRINQYNGIRLLDKLECKLPTTGLMYKLFIPYLQELAAQGNEDAIKTLDEMKRRSEWLEDRVEHKSIIKVGKEEFSVHIPQQAGNFDIKEVDYFGYPMRLKKEGEFSYSPPIGDYISVLRNYSYEGSIKLNLSCGQTEFLNDIGIRPVKFVYKGLMF